MILSLYGVEKAGPKGDLGLLGLSISNANIPPLEDRLSWLQRGRDWEIEAGGVRLLRGDTGGWKGPVALAAFCVELALRARAFSSLSALKKISRGDSSLCTVFFCSDIVGKGLFEDSLSLDLKMSLPCFKPLSPGDSGTDLE